ncbi:hypothetical protein Pelo_19515 [Pelomyxa schiedti]|nr:hypothetical protein Pelo_19515 [Pelomyxa schiedti]
MFCLSPCPIERFDCFKPAYQADRHKTRSTVTTTYSRRIETINSLEVMPICTDLIHSTTACQPHSAFTSTHQYHDSTHAATKQNSAGVPKCPLASARITVALAGSTATAPQ